MTKVAERLAAVFFAAGSCVFAADPQLMNLVMPDAKVLAGLNATSARISPLGQFILSQSSVTDGHLQRFIAATGFDPRQDAAEILAASTGDKASPNGLLLVRGSFNVDRILAAVTGKRGVTVQNYAGATLITGGGPRQKVAHSVAFIGSSIAVSGDDASVKAALDRNSHSNSVDPALAARVNTLSTSQDAWFVSSVPASGFLPANPANVKGPGSVVLPVLKNVQSSSGSVKLGSNVQFSAEAIASDPQNAASLAAVLQLLKSLAGSSPKLQSALPLIQGSEITTQGNAVNLVVSISENQAEALLASLKKSDRRAAASVPGRNRRAPEQQN